MRLFAINAGGAQQYLAPYFCYHNVMCGRYSLEKRQHELEHFYNSKMPASYRGPNYNVAPTQIMPVVTLIGLELMSWGLRPQWAKDPKIAYSLINARAETIFEKPTYRKPIISNRCLIPATGYYEWQKTGKTRQPYYYHLRNQEIFSFAGLFVAKTDDQGEIHKTYLIITCSPNKLAAEVHDRMPVILSESEQKDWLDPDIIEPDRIQQFLNPFSDNEMTAIKVGSEVGNVKNNSASLTQPI